MYAMHAERRDAILELINDRPNVRAVEIADRLDMDVEEVERALADDIGRGNVVASEILAPNGRMVQAYRMKDAPAPKAEPAKSKTDAAIEYLRNVGSKVPSQFLARAMGLSKTQHPSSYLQSAINDGRIIYEGKEWWVPEAVTEAVPAAVATPRPVVTPKAPVKTFDALAQLAAEKPAAAIPAADMPDIDVPVSWKPEALAQLQAKIPAESSAPAAEPAPTVFYASRVDGEPTEAEIRARFVETKPAETPEYEITARFHAEQVAAALTVPATLMQEPVQVPAAPAPAETPAAAPVEAPAPAPAAAALIEIAPYKPKFRAGQFSDGVLVIELGYEKITLPPEHARALRRYLAESKAAPVRVR